MEFFHGISRARHFISPTPSVRRRTFLSSVPRHLPYQALSSKLTVELWIEAFAAVVNVETFAAIPAVTGLMFLTDGYCFPVRMVSAFHVTRLSNCIMFERCPLRQEMI
jgi:hypothetical protein